MMKITVWKNHKGNTLDDELIGKIGHLCGDNVYEGMRFESIMNELKKHNFGVDTNEIMTHIEFHDVAVYVEEVHMLILASDNIIQEVYKENI